MIEIGGFVIKALVWADSNKIELQERNVPGIIDSRDVIVKVKLSSICTSDLHIINGFVPDAQSGIVLGHEFVGEVVELGEDIDNFKIGDRVSVNCETFCGECFYCKKGFINNCENGGWHLGCKIDGCQAEYVRVPYADNGLNKIPDNVSYRQALFVGDILSSGYWGAELCNITNGDSVAIIGCGPVGLCAMQSARYLGAKQIVAFDIEDERLAIAKEHNLADIYINPNKDKFDDLTDGVIECAGTDDSFNMAWQIARPNSVVALVAMYERPQILPLPSMYGKNLIFKTGGVDAVNCGELLNLLSKGILNTDFLISKEYALDNIIDAYNEFSLRNPQLLKIAISSI